MSVFLPRLVYNCEAWSNLTRKDYLDFEKTQINFLLPVMEVPLSTPTIGLYLELGMLPAPFVIELRQLTFLKKILDRDKEMLKYPSENNGMTMFLTCAINIIFLRMMTT